MEKYQGNYEKMQKEALDEALVYLANKNHDKEKRDRLYEEARRASVEQKRHNKIVKVAKEGVILLIALGLLFVVLRSANVSHQMYEDNGWTMDKNGTVYDQDGRIVPEKEIWEEYWYNSINSNIIGNPKGR